MTKIEHELQSIIDKLNELSTLNYKLKQEISDLSAKNSDLERSYHEVNEKYQELKLNLHSGENNNGSAQNVHVGKMKEELTHYIGILDECIDNLKKI